MRNHVTTNRKPSWLLNFWKKVHFVTHSRLRLPDRPVRATKFLPRCRYTISRARDTAAGRLGNATWVYGRPRSFAIGRPFSCFVIVIECPRIGRTRLVGNKHFLKIKYGVATLQKRAIFHNPRPPNVICTRDAFGFRTSNDPAWCPEVVHPPLTSGRQSSA